MARTFVTIWLLTVFCGILPAQQQEGNRIVAPVERNGFRTPTSYDSLQTFVRTVVATRQMTAQAIARTREGRSVVLVNVDTKETQRIRPRLRVLLFAQQHGDEPSGKEALSILLSKYASGENADRLARIELKVIPLMNPDGAERGQRRTSEGIDLNRSHLILSSPETEGLHQLFYTWQPEVTLDVHEYGPYSESWTAGGYVKRGDVQLGMLTNLNSSAALREYQRLRVYPFVASRVAQAGFSFQEYIVGSPGDRVRHSTTEINDGRQSFGILNTLSFIQEGRNGRVAEENLERRTRSQLAAIEALLEFCAGHTEEIRTLVAAERAKLADAAGRNFALRMEHIHGSGFLRIPAATVPGDRDTVVEISPYHDAVHAVCETTVPAGYCIPSAQGAIIALLQRHQVRMELVRSPRNAALVSFRIDSVGWDALEEDTLPRPFVTEIRETISLKPGDRIVPTDQWHSLLLATMLEPESIWGLVKYEEFGELLRGKRYPIYRIPY